MELKDYQRRVLGDLAEYLDILEKTPNLSESFTQYWDSKGATRMESYKNNVPGVPHVCAKVPTAGGKTYIAVNGLDNIFKVLTRHNPQRPQFVVWLVPSLTILEQTITNLTDPEHPYRKKLDQLFRHRVAVYEKRELLLGAGFSQDTVYSQLSIVVMTFDSLRARNKEDRKIYQENGYLANFLLNKNSEESDWLLPEYERFSLINVIRSLRPVVVVDESHNAESQLSVEMLKNLNPDFIFDLTATPRSNSNIISYVDALALKKQNMVKLPVIVANQPSRVEAIENSLILRKHLEKLAQDDLEKGQIYIRPIILFQAQPKTGEENTTFTKLKEKLVSMGISSEEIAIKTAEINELKDVDLLSRDCPIRYIITVNALKEGWDCSFAYILVSLADKYSIIDVEQIVGRILRVPYAQKHSNDLLNMSYVFTASSRFSETLQNVVKGLNRAGFSENDYRACDVNPIPNETVNGLLQLELFTSNVSPEALQNQTQTGSFSTNTLTNVTVESVGVTDVPAKEEHEVSTNNMGPNQSFLSDIPESNPMDNLDDLEQLNRFVDTLTQEQEHNEGRVLVGSGGAFVEALTTVAVQQNDEYKQKADLTDVNSVPAELEDKMNRHRVKDVHKDEIKTIEMPQFFLKVEIGGFFDEDETLQILEKEELLRNFKLAQADANIRFDDIEAEMYRIDLETIGDREYSPKPFKINLKDRERLNQYILSFSHKEQIRSVVARFVDLIGNMYPITDQEIKSYVMRIIENMNPEQIRDCLERDFAYVRKIRIKINQLASEHAERVFQDWLDVDKIVVKPSFKLSESITPTANSVAIPRSLYITEAKMGAFEQRIISHIANLESILWWHRNLSRGKGFRLNGFLNHYPDFIVKTKRGNIIALETKGDDRDNSDSELKLKLGKRWEAKAGPQYRYMMVFDNNPISGAERLADVINKLEQL